MSRQRIIVVLRGHRVILDADLAALYGVENRVLLPAVRRNVERFPADFMFQLTAEEAKRSRSQIVILNAEPSEIAQEFASVSGRSPRGKNTNISHTPSPSKESPCCRACSVARRAR